MANTLQIKRGVKGSLPTLAAGEPGFCTDTFELYVGTAASGNKAIGGMANPMTTAGDIIVGGASGAPGRLAIGTARQIPIVNSGATALEYAASLQSLMTEQGDVLYASAANTPAALPHDTSGKFLQTRGHGQNPVWASYTPPDSIAGTWSDGAVYERATYINTTTSYVKKAEWYITRPGSVRVRFTMQGTTYTVYGRIYKNGAAVGTERSTAGCEAYEEDISGLVAGDLLQIYFKSATAADFAQFGACLGLTIPLTPGALISTIVWTW
jgi:hypothetical protein